MGKIYDFNTGKEKDDTPSTDYIQRKQRCAIRAAELKGLCDCPVCVGKDDIAATVVITAHQMCDQFSQDTGNKLYLADWLEVLMLATLTLQQYLYPDE